MNDGAIDHGVFVVSIRCQMVENVFPNTLFLPNRLNLHERPSKTQTFPANRATESQRDNDTKWRQQITDCLRRSRPRCLPVPAKNLRFFPMGRLSKHSVASSVDPSGKSTPYQAHGFTFVNPLIDDTP